MADAGLIVLVSFISPFRSEREMARSLLEAGEFVEIFIDTPLNICEQRDPKGLYKKARAGEIANFTGIDSNYEAPIDPELRLDTTKLSVNASKSEIIEYLRNKGNCVNGSHRVGEFPCPLGKTLTEWLFWNYATGT